VKVRLNSAFALFIAFSAGSVSAQTSQGLPRANFLAAVNGEFRKIDADKNGIVTRLEIEMFQRVVAVAEAGQRNRALFKQLDSDENGQVSPAEFGKLAAPPTINAQPMLSRYDANRDGKVGEIEYRTVKLSRFDQMDADKDGTITNAEQGAAGLLK
jgi:Ca2+-binding EF-hand superfamily protein